MLNDIRTGQGFDVHAFTNDKNTTRLCGVDIPFHMGLKGHSDADVALHALCDALLGTIGAGDIGDLFPPSENKWKGADSFIFVKEALRKIDEHNGRLCHIDLTIICEMPKIGPHKTEMKQKLCDFLKLPATHVNIKATTTEKLGFTGRGEGIAAMCIATVDFTKTAP